MQQSSITIKNIDREIIELLREIRIVERRQLAAIFEDCIREYWNNTYGDDD